MHDCQVSVRKSSELLTKSRLTFDHAESQCLSEAVHAQVPHCRRCKLLVHSCRSHRGCRVPLLGSATMHHAKKVSTLAGSVAALISMDETAGLPAHVAKLFPGC